MSAYKPISAFAATLFLTVILSINASGQGIELCDQFTGTDAGAKIANCIAALPSGGGIADARGFGAGLQTISSQLDIGGSGKPVTLLINPATQFQCTEIALTHYCLRLWNGSHVRGEGAGGAQGGFAANFRAASGAKLAGLISNWPRDGTVEFFSIQNLTLRSDSGSVITDGLVDLSGIFAGSYVRDVYTVYCAGGGSALYMTSPAGAIVNITSDITFVNDNFDCGNASAGGPSVQIIDGSSASAIESINFVEVQMQHPGSGQPIEVINGDGSDQCGSITHKGVHYETSSGLASYGPYVAITDCHDISFEDINTGGSNPSSGNGMTISQTAANTTHGIFIHNWRQLGAITNVVSSSVAGIANLPFAADADGAMSIAEWEGLPNNSNLTLYNKSNVPALTVLNSTAANDACTLGWANDNKFRITCNNNRSLVFTNNSVGDAWQINNAANPAIMAVTDGIGDIGASGGNRPNNIYIKNNLYVGGAIYKGADYFKIDHPLDPENKYLVHSVVESPDMKNIYDGVIVLNRRGEAVVELPPWFQALNKEFRYQLTCIGGSAPVYIAQEIHNNRFRIAGGKRGLKVSWQVTGVRHDPFATSHPMQVEEAKPERQLDGSVVPWKLDSKR